MGNPLWISLNILSNLRGEAADFPGGFDLIICSDLLVYPDVEYPASDSASF